MEFRTEAIKMVTERGLSDERVAERLGCGTESVRRWVIDHRRDILAKAEANQATARRVIETSGVMKAWKSIGAEVHLVGSLATGLLMKNRDIDFHIYSLFAGWVAFAPDSPSTRSISAAARCASANALRY